MNIKFISYTGKYPDRCNGVLTLLIDGAEHTFCPLTKGAEHGKIWSSGGNCRTCEKGAWTHDWFDAECDDLDYHFGEGFSDRLIEVMNDNVPYGCCGGCK